MHMSSNVSSASRNHVAEFYNMFCFGEGIASGKHVAQLQTNQRRLVRRSTERRSNKMADSSIRVSPSVLSFRLYYVNSKLTVTAAGTTTTTNKQAK